MNKADIHGSSQCHTDNTLISGRLVPASQAVPAPHPASWAGYPETCICTWLHADPRKVDDLDVALTPPPMHMLHRVTVGFDGAPVHHITLQLRNCNCITFFNLSLNVQLKIVDDVYVNTLSK